MRIAAQHPLIDRSPAALTRRANPRHADGRVVHYSPYDPSGRVHPGPSVTDNGFWDTFRTVYPMLSLLYPGI